VKTLPPAFNTLKAHTLYLRLDHDRKKGVYDAARFLEYLKLPRSLSYVNPKWLETVREKQPMADVNADLSSAADHPPPHRRRRSAGREYFLNIFQQAAWQNRGDISEKLLDPYTDYVRESWLKPVFAEAIITSGFDKPDRWASFLTPQAFQQLKDRVDIEFPRDECAILCAGRGRAIRRDAEETRRNSSSRFMS
jgi:hypothetical protein